MDQISRREFATVIATGAVAGGAMHAGAFTQATTGGVLTAATIIDRIRANVGVEWKADTVDALKAGGAEARVTGVVTTALASMTVLRQAVAIGANMVISFEPTFYSRSDSPRPPAGRGRGAGPAAAAPPPPPPPDRVFTAKNDFITRNGLVVYRLSDHWRARTPDPLATGLATALGWPGRQSSDDARLVDLGAGAVTLGALTRTVAKALGSRGGVRVIGDPQTRVQRVGLLPGSTAIQASLAMLPTVDVIVAGEVREWESVEYVRDVVFSGQRKGMILVGRIVSEEPGMAACAAWLRTFVPEVPVRHIGAGDPYWRPA